MFLGSSYLHCPLWMNSTSLHPGHPFTANPSLVMPDKVLPLDLKFEQLSHLCKSQWESFLLLLFLSPRQREAGEKQTEGIRDGERDGDRDRKRGWEVVTMVQPREAERLK